MDEPLTPAEQDEEERWRFMLHHHHGRAFIFGLLEQTRVFSASFTGEPLTTAFNEGRRDIGIRLLAETMRRDANALTVMKVEDTDRQTRHHVIPDEKDEDE